MITPRSPCTRSAIACPWSPLVLRNVRSRAWKSSPSTIVPVPGILVGTPSGTGSVTFSA